MAQNTAFGSAEMLTLFKVQKADGQTKYYKVVKEKNIEITVEEYSKLGGK